MIIHSRFAAPLVNDHFTSAQGTVNIDSHLPDSPDKPPLRLPKRHYVKRMSDTTITKPWEYLDYNGDFLCKRIRIVCDVPAPFYLLTASDIAVGIFWESQGSLGDHCQDFYCIETSNRYNMNEWVDVNMLLPRNDDSKSAKAFAAGLTTPGQPYIGAWYGGCNAQYSGVPTNLLNQPFRIALEVEMAMTLDKANWNGARQ